MKLTQNLVYVLTVSILLTSVFAVTLGFNQEVSAAENNATDEVNVTVNINEKCIVDISPSSLNWSTPIDPGSTDTYKYIQVDNMGSVNLTHIWFNNSYPATRPFGTGDVSLYDAGNFMTVSVNQDGQTYYFPNRVEYNETNMIVYLIGPDGALGENINWPYGRFRNASREYFWALDDGAWPGDGNYTNAEICVSDNPHTQTDTGDNNLQTGTRETLVPVTGNGNWGVTDININGMQICAAAYHDGTKVMFFKYNMDAPGADQCSNAEYFLNATGSASSEIPPGASSYARVAPFVPYGVVYDETNSYISGTLTVLVNVVD